MNQKLNPAHCSALMHMVNQCAYFAHTGIRLVKLDHGYAAVEADITEWLCNPFGTVHGGVYASVIDTVTYWAAYGNRDEDTGFTTLDLQVNHLAMAQKGKLIATATAVKEGRSVCLCEGIIEDNTGRILAHGTSKLLILEGRQRIGDAVRHLGAPPLPPKFLPE